MNDLDCVADFIAELILLCDMPKEAQLRIGIILTLDGLLPKFLVLAK